MEQAAGVKRPELVLPTDPDDYYRANSGLFVPIRESAPGSGEQQTLLLDTEAINTYPDDILERTEAPTSTYEPAYLWYDAPAALNRVIDSASLDSLKEKLGSYSSSRSVTSCYQCSTAGRARRSWPLSRVISTRC